MTPKRPIHWSEIEPETWYSGTDREIRGRALCDVGGASRLGVGVLELPPGSNTRPAHYHSREEEHLYVLAGRATLHLGEDRFDMIPGAYVCFPAGQPVPHYLDNDGTEVFRYLMVGERIDDDHVVHVHG